MFFFLDGAVCTILKKFGTGPELNYNLLTKMGDFQIWRVIIIGTFSDGGPARSYAPAKISQNMLDLAKHSCSLIMHDLRKLSLTY